MCCQWSSLFFTSRETSAQLTEINSTVWRSEKKEKEKKKFRLTQRKEVWGKFINRSVKQKLDQVIYYVWYYIYILNYYFYLIKHYYFKHVFSKMILLSIHLLFLFFRCTANIWENYFTNNKTLKHLFYTWPPSVAASFLCSTSKPFLGAVCCHNNKVPAGQFVCKWYWPDIPAFT